MRARLREFQVSEALRIEVGFGSGSCGGFECERAMDESGSGVKGGALEVGFRVIWRRDLTLVLVSELLGRSFRSAAAAR